MTDAGDPFESVRNWLEPARLGRTWPMLFVKQALGDRDRDEAFGLYQEALQGSAGARLAWARLRSLLEVARESAVEFLELAPAGASFENRPPKVVGEGDQRLLLGTERTLYVAAFEDVVVRGRSQLLQYRGEALLDYEDWELARVDDEMRLDSAVFAQESEGLWLIDEPAGEELSVAEAFSLLGPNTYAWGHWLSEYLPRLWMAIANGRLPQITVLIDRGMAPQQRALLELLVPDGTTILEVAPMQRVRVHKLWTAPTIYYAPMYPAFNERFRYDFVAESPRYFERIYAGMWERLAPSCDAPPTGRRLYLARKPSSHRKLVNHVEVEEVATAQGFERVYVEDLDVREQLRALRGASHVMGPEGSAFFLAFFARPGTKVCILNHPHVEFLTTVTALIDATGAECTVVTGPFERIEDDGYLHFSDYRIDPAGLSRFLSEWAPL